MNTKKLIRFDWAMKYILRNKANFDILEGFLSNLLKEEIKVDDVIDSFSNQDDPQAKFNCVDLKCRDSRNRQMIIEVQNQREYDYFQRILWGASKVVVESINLGESYKNVAKVISISILYYPFRADEKKNSDFIYRGITKMYGVHNNQPLVLHGKIVKGEEAASITSRKVFPEYYMIYVDQFEDVINDAIDEWVYFFKYGKIQENFSSPGILLAAHKLDYLAMKDDERRAYDEYMAYLGKEIGMFESAVLDGKEEGERIGIEKGKQIGIQEGKLAGKLETAKNLRAMGLKDEDIARATGLCMEEIIRL